MREYWQEEKKKSFLNSWWFVIVGFGLMVLGIILGAGMLMDWLLKSIMGE